MEKMIIRSLNEYSLAKAVAVPNQKRKTFGLRVFNKNPETNANFFNVDMVYTWQFAEGSFINVGWKNAGTLFNQQTADPYYKNLGNILKEPQENNFSVKIIYYLDYLTLKKKG